MATYVEIEDDEVAPEAPVTTSLMTRLRDNALSYLGAAEGVQIVVRNSTAPLGWTKLLVENNVGMRIVTGLVSVLAGNAYSATLASGRSTDGLALNNSQLPLTGLTGTYIGSSGSLTYTVANPGVIGYQIGGSVANHIASSVIAPVGGVPGGTITIVGFGGGQTHAHGINMSVRTLDFILCEKDA